MPRRRVAVGVFCTWAFILCLSCTAEQRKSLSQLRDAQVAVAKDYPDGTVNMNLVNGSHLVISVLNSTFNTKTDAERSSQARQSARTAVALLDEQLEDVRVVFLSRAGVGITVTKTIASYSFTSTELRSSE